LKRRASASGSEPTSDSDHSVERQSWFAELFSAL